MFSSYKAFITLLFVITLVAYGFSKPAPGNHLRLSLRSPSPVFESIPLGYAAPIAAYNLPLDAATASQRVDIHNRYNLVVPAPPLKVIASPYVAPARFIAAAPYPYANPYYSPNMFVGPIAAPTTQLRYVAPGPFVYPGNRVFIR